MIRLVLALALVSVRNAAAPGAEPPLASPVEMAASRLDVWAEAAIRAPGGPSYEFYRDLLPPLRYVNTAFKYYPIVLSAPQTVLKARYASNGSGVNLKADKPPMWKEAGTPVAFFIGEDAVDFGADAENLFGPVLALSPRRIEKYPPKTGQFWLPIVETMNRTGEKWCEQFAFAPTRGVLSEQGAVCVRFLPRRSEGVIRARIGVGAQYTADKFNIRNADSNVVVMFDSTWTWNHEKSELTARIPKDQTADLIVLTKPLQQPLKELPSFEVEQQSLLEDWCDVLLQRSKARLDIPEAIVQNAWQSLVVGNFMIARGDRMNYSAGNAYDHLYESECGDAVRSLMLMGHMADARKMVGPLLDFDRKATRFHVAGHKLQLLTHYYWVTRDKEYIEQTRAKWEPVVAFIRNSRKTANGLLPKDNFAGDVNTQIFSLNSNANCWRGVRDMAAVLEDIGDKTLAKELRSEADAFRKVILDAVAKSVNAEKKFVPLSLLGDEPAHDPITATRMGSYYNLMIPYGLGSGLLGDERDGWIIDYLRQHGGLAMGMIRSTPHQGEFDKQPGVNPLYGLRYNLTILRRGDRDHALAGFYGHLAQGMTRDTFIGGEGSRFFHGDKQGRSFYLPPNSASNAAYLITLRYLLVQDWDLNDDGVPETLRFCDAIPPRWLVDGAILRVENAPTTFGEVSFTITSKLKQGEILVEVQTPARAVTKWHLRLPDPPGYTIDRATIGGEELKRDAESRIDLIGRSGKFEVKFTVKPR